MKELLKKIIKNILFVIIWTLVLFISLSLVTIFLPNGINVLVSILIIFALAEFLKKRKFKKEAEEKLRKKEEKEALIKKEKQREKEEEENEAALIEKERLREINETKFLVGYGIKEPIFELEDTSEYKEKIIDIKMKQKELIKDNEAVMSSTNWTINGSLYEGKKSTNRYIKLTLLAFNSTCDVEISKVSWNNVETRLSRINNDFEKINKLLELNSLSINRSYLNLKLKELIITFEEKEFKQKEKEFQQEERRIQKELDLSERALLKDIEDFEKKEKELYLKIKNTTLIDEINKLKKEIEQIKAEKERTKSMAEQTKAGYVYIISNRGSFGKNVFKIGLTRRLNPEDRVKELSSASVPFIFDIHSMIFSKNAPKLEKELHSIFNEYRVNKINNRKEFFKVDIQILENKIKEHLGDQEIKFIKEVEAKDYYLSIKDNFTKSN